MFLNVLSHIIVVRKLIGSYDTHYGVRSVVHEVQRIAVQLVADAHIQGRLRAKYVDFFDHLDLYLTGERRPFAAGWHIYNSTRSETSNYKRLTVKV